MTMPNDDFVLDTVGDAEGDVSGSQRGTGGAQAIPKDAWMGEPDYEGQEMQGKVSALAAFFSALFVPQAMPNADIVGTPEHEFVTSNEQMFNQLRDVFRYIGARPIQMVVAPSRNIAAAQTVVGTEARSILGYQPDRLRVLLSNTHADQDVFFSGEPNVTVTDGFTLAAGQSIEIATKSEIHAIASGAATTLNYLVESGV